MPRGKRELLIFLADTCPVAVTAIPRVLRIIRSVAAAGFFAYFRGTCPLSPLSSVHLLRDLSPCRRWAPCVFCEAYPAAAPRIFRRACPAGPVRAPQKQKIRLLCNFFSIRDSLLFPKSENKPFHGRFTAFSSRYPHFGAPEQSLIAKKLQYGPNFCFRAPEEASNQRYKRDRRAPREATL